MILHEARSQFTINLPGDGTYAFKLFDGVDIEESDGTTIGRWPASA